MMRRRRLRKKSYLYVRKTPRTLMDDFRPFFSSKRPHIKLPNPYWSPALEKYYRRGLAKTPKKKRRSSESLLPKD